jgi:hypothetical protein
MSGFIGKGYERATNLPFEAGLPMIVMAALVSAIYARTVGGGWPGHARP